MLAVMAVAPSDERLAIRSLKKSKELGNNGKHDLLLVVDTGYDESALVEECDVSFNSVDVLKISKCPRGNDWPRPQNWAWQQAAKSINNGRFNGVRSWFWWEPDALPLKANWLDILERHHNKALKPFSGFIVDEPGGGKYMAGVGIYPVNISSYCPSALRVMDHPFDIVAGRIDHCIMHVNNISPVITHVVLPTRESSVDDTTDIDEECVLFHPFKKLTDNPEESKANKVEAEKKLDEQFENTFYHSGDLGDIIYSLPTIIELGGGNIVLGQDNRTLRQNREKMTEQRFEVIKELLECQPYIGTVTYSGELTGQVTVDLNQFRNYFAGKWNPSLNLARVFLKYFRCNEDADKQKWLTVPESKGKTKEYPVVINRSSRYHNSSFNWKLILKKYAGQACFIGLKDEHTEFEKEFGYIPYIATSTLLEAAQIINKCQLFIGNQSVCYSIAEGLKKDAILEYSSQVPNCKFERKNAIYGCTTRTKLPDINRKIRSYIKNKLVIQSTVDAFTGYGQAVLNITKELLKKKYNVSVIPAGFDERVPLPDFYKKCISEKEDIAGLLFHTHDTFPALLSEGQVVFTMWESTRISRTAINAINQKASRVIVPSVWSASCFSASGVDKKISIVPLGIDPEEYGKTTRMPTKTVFGVAGRFAHGGMRKGFMESINAFLSEFDENEDVELHIKCHEDCAIDFPEDKRVIINREFMPSLKPWYDDISVFVSAARGEGWGLHQLQAMASGRPVISPAYGALQEYFDEGVGYPVEFEIVDADGVYEGFGAWCKPSVTSIKEQMRRVYEDRKELLSKGKMSRKRALKFTWKNTAEKLESVLKAEGIL